MPLVGGFSGGSSVSPALSFRRCSILTSITLFGSQDLDVKSRPNLFTSLHSSLIVRLRKPIPCHSRGRGGGVVVRLLASHQGEPGSISGGTALGFSHVGIVPDDAAGRRFSSWVSRFPRPSHSGAAPHPPRFILIGSQDLDV
ncbi:hypothetical protein PR048_027971 [Dryococelus australis]|uniref:Uncharacterized protein n=1 Tax=Dryococelus australis TaxID=614101 RepID=A0ABQ9GI23_9NEOP|nr:hypothetical protein PR048_027971 [Dryococelus australis]